MKITEFYSAMSHGQKVTFWTLVSNVFLVIFTFWMGLFVQDFIADKNANLTKELVRFDYIDRIYPTYKSMISSEVMDSMWMYTMEKNELANSESDNNRIMLKAGDYIDRNRDKIMAWADTMCSVLGDFKYYLKPEYFDSISYNNTEILICLQTMRLLESDSTKSMTKKEFEDNLKAFLCSIKFKHSAVISKNIHQASDLVGKLFDVYSGADTSVNNAFKRILALDMLEAITRNNGILEKALSYSTKKDEFKLKTEPWLFLLIALLIGIVISLTFARFITSRQSIKSVSTVDYRRLETRIHELEALKILSEEERNRYQTILSEKDNLINQHLQLISSLHEVINTKDAIISEDIEELKKLRDTIRTAQSESSEE